MLHKKQLIPVIRESAAYKGHSPLCERQADSNFERLPILAGFF